MEGFQVEMRLMLIQVTCLTDKISELKCIKKIFFSPIIIILAISCYDFI